MVTPSSWPGDCVITPELDRISVWYHMHPATRRDPGTPWTRKVLPVDNGLPRGRSAADFVDQTTQYPSSKYVCACNIRPYLKNDLTSEYNPVMHPVISVLCCLLPRASNTTAVYIQVSHSCYIYLAGLYTAPLERAHNLPPI